MKKLSIFAMIMIALASCGEKTVKSSSIEDTEGKVKARLCAVEYKSLNGWTFQGDPITVVRYVDPMLTVGDVVNINTQNYEILSFEEIGAPYQFGVQFIKEDSVMVFDVYNKDSAISYIHVDELPIILYSLNQNY